MSRPELDQLEWEILNVMLTMSGRRRWWSGGHLSWQRHHSFDSRGTYSNVLRSLAKKLPFVIPGPEENELDYRIDVQLLFKMWWTEGETKPDYAELLEAAGII